MRKSTASCESLALFILGIKAFSERNFHFNLHLMVLNICLWRWRFESVANIGQIVPRHFINHRNTRVISTFQKILDLINTCYMSSSKFYWINKDSINWKSFDSSKGKSFFKKVIPNSGGDGRHKGAPSRGSVRCMLGCGRRQNRSGPTNNNKRSLPFQCILLHLDSILVQFTNNQLYIGMWNPDLWLKI